MKILTVANIKKIDNSHMYTFDCISKHAVKLGVAEGNLTEYQYVSALA